MKRKPSTLMLLMVLCLPMVTFAVQLVPCDGPSCQACHLVELGQNILTWLISVMATIIAIVVVVAGIKMVTSAGNPGKVSEAKEMMKNAIIGFIILLAAWLIVDTIIKTFVDNSKIGVWHRIECVPQPDYKKPPTGVVTPVPGACTVPPLTPITDPLAQQMEAMNGNAVIWENTNPQLKRCVDKFIGLVGGRVTSAYRPQAYQTHLWEISDRWCAQGLRSNNDEACSTLKATISDEVQKHFGGNWDCGAVASTNSSHSNGTGVDISGIEHGSTRVTQAANNTCLNWDNYPGDPWHYSLKSGCNFNLCQP